MVEFLASVKFPGRVTFFCTKVYECVAASGHETAPHPYLGKDSDWERELAGMRAAFQHATGWRAHSCVFSHILAEWLGKNGYRYVSTHDQFGCRAIQPHRHCWGVWHLPIYYMDNLDFSRPSFWSDDAEPPFSASLIERALSDDGVYVFDFHPIHLLLNTPEPRHYMDVRDRFKNGEPIETLRYGGYGTGSFFRDLCDAMAAKDEESITMAEALDRFIAESAP